MADHDERISDAAEEIEDNTESFVSKKPLTSLVIAMLVGALAAKIVF